MIQVHPVSGRADFSVPLEFEKYSNALFAKESVSHREFADFCMLAARLIDDNWDKRHGMAYHLSGAWLKYKNISDDDLLDGIGAEFGTLELPDHHAAGSEEKVRRKWLEVKKLAKEADKKF